MNFTRRITILMLTMVLLFTCLPITASAAGNTMYGIGFVNASSLRLRSEASTDAAVVDTASANECVVVVSKIGDWYQVIYNLKSGYMHASYMDVASKENAELGYGNITGSGVNLRSGPATTYSVSAVSAKGEKCYIIGLNEGWYKVIYNGKICYIRSDFVALTEIPYENKASNHSPKFFRRGESTGVVPSAAALNGAPSSGSAVPSEKNLSVTGSQILNEARKYLGTPYVAGGASPSGFDCSGFVYYILKQLGFSPYRTPASQYQHGNAVSKATLQEGDLVFFSSNSGKSITHVGIYAGGGQFIHAPNSRSVVSYSDLTSGYWANTYYGARRIV